LYVKFRQSAARQDDRFGSLNETARAVERCAQGGAWD
jgi:hypothetical protein